VLTEFRARLLADSQTERLLTLMLDRVRERGLLHGGGRQRTDATHVRMAVRDLHRLEQVIETLGAGLEALAVVAPAWPAGLIPPEWTSRYGQRGDHWRLPKAEQARLERAVEVGRDGLVPLEALYGPDAPAGLADLEAVQVLRATWIQQFYLHDGQVRWRNEQTGLPPGKLLILNPYDLDARPGVKRGRNRRSSGRPSGSRTAAPHRDRARCTRSQDNARHVTFLPRRQQQAQQRLWAEQATDAWRRAMPCAAAWRA
jgi:hypothetical protein